MKESNEKSLWRVIFEVLPLLLVKFSVVNNQQVIIFGHKYRLFLEKDFHILLEIKSLFLGSSSGSVWKLFLITDPLLFNSKMSFNITNHLQKKIQTTSLLWTSPKKFVKLLLQSLFFNKTSNTNQQIRYIFFL